MRHNVVLLGVILALSALAAHAQCRSGYSMTSGDVACTGESMTAHAPLPQHTGPAVRRQVAGDITCRAGIISWNDKGEPVCADDGSSSVERSPSLQSLWRGLGWLLGF
jgi:hypothetical protein